jgi:hypothetical protein
MIRMNRFLGVHSLGGALAAAVAIVAVAGCSAQHRSDAAALSQLHSNIPAAPSHSDSPSPGTSRTDVSRLSPTPTAPGTTHRPEAHTSTPTSATPRPTTRSPSASPRPPQAGSMCITSAQMGHCPFGQYAGITGASTDPYVDQDVWSPISGWRQTLYASNPGHWYVTANMAAGNTAVVSFPNTGFFYNKALSQFSSIISSFTDSIPVRTGTNAEASYDIWFKNTGAIDEVMIQNDYSPGRAPSCGTWTATSVRFGGSKGVPVHPWDLCVSGSTAYWETANGNMPSGTVDVLAMLNWLVRHGQLPTGVELGGFSYGFEVSSTDGVSETFAVKRFTAAAS